ncbi:glycosyltransferase [Rhodovulum sp.]|uniref:glycosyltransferase n=1 Tax=Rhodovulum sp. TaxID=34009 RepID=UPI00257F09B8|nr:glycosyltransferase family 2 protein [Rhodovulum sp.]
MISQDHYPLARTRFTAGISIIVPTYREVENIPLLLARIDALRRDRDLTLEVLFMDDDSRDGSIEAVERSGFDWARIIVRQGPRGLSAAVIDGFRAARYPVLFCMDCDLSHPPERIPAMILALDAGQQMVIGSRYVPGGSTDDDWGFWRWINSRIATLLARPLTQVRDPMSGFFALRKADFDQARDLNPVGYKIALELIVKCGLENVGEVPIHFSDRVHGVSKLTFREQLKYIQHLRRLYLHRFANAMYMAQFLVVGASGVVVNLSVLSLLKWAGLPDMLCLAGGIAVSVITNFLLNRRFTFSYAKDRPILKQFAGFVGASAVGMAVNYGVALYLNAHVLGAGPLSLQFAALGGIVAGMLFNFLGSRYFVFHKRFVKR